MPKLLKLLILLSILLLAPADYPVDAQTTGFDRREPSERIRFGPYSFDPLGAGVPALTHAGAPLDDGGRGLFLLQTDGPISEALQLSIESDLAIIQHVPYEAYIVWGTVDGVSRAASRTSGVRWSGEWHVDFRIDPLLAAARSGDRVRMSAKFVDDGNLDAVAKRIEDAGGVVLAREAYQRVNRELMVMVWEFMLAPANVSIFYDVPSLIYVSEMGVAAAHDELSDQIVAGKNGAVTNPSVGYRQWLVQTGYDGGGNIVAIVDTGVDWDHLDLNVVSGNEYGGYVENAFEPGSDNMGHGTHVAGIVAGSAASNAKDGSGYLYGLGVAPGSALHAQDYLDTGTQPSTQTIIRNSYDSGAALSQNSWGLLGTLNPWDGRYDRWAPDYDRYTVDANPLTAQMESLLHVFSAGNDGDNGGAAVNPCPGGNPCVPSAVAPGVAKNVISVGSTDTWRPDGDFPGVDLQLDDLTAFSTRGLSQDNRIKPDVVAPGRNIVSARNSSGFTSCSNVPISPSYTFCSGTSMAAPHVAGVASLFTEMWRDRMNDPRIIPDPALVKAAIIATTDDIQGGVDGFGNTIAARPNGDQGWGIVNADRLLNPAYPILYYENPMLMTADGQDWTIDVIAANLGEPLRITLVWSDVAGIANANPARVNDLDLEVTDPAATVWGANRFSATGWSSAGSVFEANNNVENVWIASPTSGNYTINVDAYALRGRAWLPNSGDSNFNQHFSVVCYNCIEKQYVDADSDNGLVAYWTFDSEIPAVTGYVDMSLNGNRLSSGPFPGSCVCVVPSNSAFANPRSTYVAGGATDYFSAPDSGSLDVGEQLTLAAWVKLDDASKDQRVIAKSTYALGVANNQLVAQIYDSSGTWYTLVAGSVPSNPAPSTTWTHIAMTYAKDGYLIGYVNGVDVGRIDAGDAIAGNSAPLLLGTANWDPAGMASKGFIDEARVYNKAIKQSGIKRLGIGWDCETDGASWATAHHSLQCALTMSDLYAIYGSMIDEIDVADGTYLPGSGRLQSFVHKASGERGGLKILGGFAGDYGETRNPQAFPSILSGDVDRNDYGGAPFGRNSYHVFKNQAGGLTLSGFTIEGGFGDDEGVDAQGGGVYDSAGGNYDLMTFRNNVVDGFGGAMIVHGANVTIQSSRFLGNRSNNDGGALYSNLAGTHLFGVLFSGNTALNHGGALFVNGSLSGPLILFNNTLVHNEATNFNNSGGAWIQNTSSLISDSILWDNDPDGTTQIVLAGSGTPTVKYSIVEGGFAGDNNLSSDPLFVDADGADNSFGTIDDNPRPARSSPAIDSGGSDCIIGKVVPTPNIDGDGSISFDECDRGAYEFGLLLVVEDDDQIGELGGAAEVSREIVDGLVAAGMAFDWWSTGIGNSSEPGAERLAPHNRVLWFTGANLTPQVGPTVSAENDLISWLDSGRRCFMMSSMNYFFTQSIISPFAVNYLGVQGVSQDAGYSSVSGAGLFNGLSYGVGKTRLLPLYFDNSDVITANGLTGSASLFSSPSGSAAVGRETDVFRTAFLGFSAATISDNAASAAADRGALFERFFDDCESGLTIPIPTATTLRQASTARDRALLPSIALIAAAAALLFILWRRRRFAG